MSRIIITLLTAFSVPRIFTITWFLHVKERVADSWEIVVGGGSFVIEGM
jgi:hypothetical protein